LLEDGSWLATTFCSGAAIAEGIESAEIFVGDFDDHGMVRVYTRENATQRGNSATAIAGSIASAIRLLAKAILVGDERIARNLAIQIPEARGNLASGKGIGHDLIERLLAEAPQLTTYVIQQQLVSLGMPDFPDNRVIAWVVVCSDGTEKRIPWLRDPQTPEEIELSESARLIIQKALDQEAAQTLMSGRQRRHKNRRLRQSANRLR
jgi:hypothetical protein